MTTPRTTPDAASGVNVGVSGGLWIRVSTNLSERKVTWRLAEMMRRSHGYIRDAGPAYPTDLVVLSAESLLLNLWGKIAEHTKDGVITAIPDGQLEEWAKWRGDVGAFAAWVRAHHFDAETGTVREWEDFAGALQSKRASDAQRQKNKRDRDRAAREAELTVLQSRTDAPASTTEPPRVVDKSALALSLTIAANKGMAENDAIANVFNPMVAGRGDAIEAVDHFLENGVGVDDFPLLARMVFTLAKRYVPTRRGDYIRSLTYFRESALLMLQRHKAQEATRNAPGLAEVDDTGIRRGVSRSTGDARGRVQRATVGAFAGGALAGLPDDDDLEPYRG